MMAKKQDPGRGMIIAVAVFVSVILYLSGVFSGLYASRVIEARTQMSLDGLKNETKEDISVLTRNTRDQINVMKEYIAFLESNMNDANIEQLFMETLSHDEMCNFTEMSMDNLFDELNYFWGILPYRIEEYENRNTLTDEYINVKKRYERLAIRTWVIAKKHYESCGTRIVHGLHFYSRNCTICTRQGQELDILSRDLKDRGYDVVIFTIDIDSDEPIIKFLRAYYHISTVPALILNNRVYQGQVFMHGDLLRDIS